MSMELFLLRLFFCFCFVTTQCISIIQKVKLIKTHSLTLTAATSNSRQATDKPLKALYSSERPLSGNEAHICGEQPVDTLLLQRELESFGLTHVCTIRG